jgi:signal transduction histidine kinase/ligand-binding sensor domain-containing protein
MKKLYTLLLVAVSVICHAQYRDLHFEYLNVVEGLPESQITALHQDNLGYIWVGTQNGLVRYDGYKVKVYKLGSDIKGSLKDFSVDDIYETKAGDLWVASRSNWLFHYNRAADSFEQYIIGEQYNGFRFKAMTIDNDGYIWLSPATLLRFSGPQSFPAARLNIETRKEDKFPYAVTSLVNSKSGRVWLGTDKGLVYYDRSAGKMSKVFFPLTGKDKQYITHLYEAPSEPGILWFNLVDVQYKSFGLYSFDTRSHQYKKYMTEPLVPGTIASNDIYMIQEDDRGRLWFGTSAGLSLFDRVSSNFKNYTPPIPLDGSKENPVSNMAAQPDGKLWLGTYFNRNGNGLLLFDPVDGSFKRYAHDERKPYSLNNDRVIMPMTDRTGSLWVGIAWGGLDRVSALRTQFDTWLPGAGDKNSYPAGGVLGAALSADGYCWIGSKEGFIRWKPNTDLFERVSLPSFIKKDNVGVLTTDREGLIWCKSTGVSLFTYDSKTGRVDTLRYPGKWSSTTIGAVYQDRDGLIWIGTGGDGLYSYDKHTRKFTAYPYETSINDIRYSGKKLDNNRVLSIYEDRQGVLWVGTNLGGLNRYNKQNGTFTSFFDMTKGLNCVNHIYEDKAGRFWAGTYLSGLFSFDRKTGRSKQFTEKGGLLDDDIAGLQEGPDGNLWLRCQRGFTRFNPVNSTYTYYTANNALPFAFERPILNPFLKTGDNQFIAFSRDGIVSFYPGKLGKNAYPPEVQIETIAYNDPQSNDAQITTEELYGKRQVELPHNQNRIRFDYVALHYENPAQNRYAYQLVGYDKNWVQAGTQRSVTYTNLSPGTYTFKVKASNSDGVWNKKGASVIIVIHAPWWATWWAWVLWIVLFVSAVYAFVAYRSRKLLHDKRVLEHKVHIRTEEVMQQKEEIEAQRDNLEKAFGELKTTQTQLIQSEKMASLGELTAGIAHEIQNPLNFVNNFSEVNAELIGEMKEEIAKGDLEEIKLLAVDIEENSKKINMHGKRADAIVKSMLQHSQSGSATKEPTDMNALADEYLRLSYHGLRAKDKEFNAVMTTSYDPNLPKVNVIAQDMGRVLLNLFNNAFYAVNQKKKTAGGDYKPEVSVSTSTANGQVIIKVKDNGTGIPDAVKEKIMQPFFTTKPTGEGTGLGLSLTYDMVVKGHSGSIQVNSEEGEGSEFIVKLPTHLPNE